MSFRELMEKYRDGTATAEERALFERELEKFESLTEYAAREEDGALPLHMLPLLAFGPRRAPPFPPGGAAFRPARPRRAGSRVRRAAPV